MKKLLSLIIVLMTIITLAGCVPEDNSAYIIDDEKQAQIDLLNERISDLEQSSIETLNELKAQTANKNNLQSELDRANGQISNLEKSSHRNFNELMDQKAITDNLQSELDEANALIDYMYGELKDLYEEQGIDFELLFVVQTQKEAILNIGNEIPEGDLSTIDYNTDSFKGNIQFPSASVSSHKLDPTFTNDVSPFELDDEWKDISATYYGLLEEIVLQGYDEGTIINIDEFILQQPLDYYVVNASTNSEHFIEINLDGNETLFSQVLFYDDITIEDAKVVKARTVEAEFVESKLHLRTITQTFDENQLINGIELEDFKEDTGLVKVTFSDEGSLTKQYSIGYNVREGLNTILDYQYGEYERFMANQTLQYFSGNEVTEMVGFRNNYAEYLAKMSDAQKHLDSGSLGKGEITIVYNMFSSKGSDDILYDYEEFHDHRDIFTIEVGNTLGINFEELEPLYNIYLKMFNFQALADEIKVLEAEDESYEITAVIATKKGELNQIGSELLSYEYKGTLYSFTHYDENRSKYSLRGYGWDEENLVYYDIDTGGSITEFERRIIHLAQIEYSKHKNLAIGGKIKTQYEELLNFNASPTYDVNGDIDPNSMIPFINKMQLVGSLGFVFREFNPDILMIKNENRIVLSQEYIDTKNMDDYVLINGTLIEDSDLPNQDVYLIDYEFVIDNETMILDLFPPYYSMNKEELVNYLLESGSIYQAPIIEDENTID